MKMTVDVPDEVKNELYLKAREDIENSITESALLQYMHDNNSPSVAELLRSFNINRRYEDIVDRGISVKDLTCNDKLVCMLYWMMYEKLWG